MKRRARKFPESPAPVPEPVSEPEVLSMSNTKAELLQAAQERGLDVTSRNTKAEILDALNQAPE